MSKPSGLHLPDPWERQEGETPKAYAAFCVYRDLGPSRSCRETAEKLGKSQKNIQLFSAKNHWVERAAKWDEEQDRIARQEQIKEIKKMRKRHADLATAMLIKAAKALQRIPDDEIRASDVSRMVDTASRLERISRGDSETVVEERDGGTATPTVQFYIPDNHRDDEEQPEEEQP